VRYLAEAEPAGHEWRARVAPVEVDADSAEGRIAGPMNVVTIQTELTGPITFSGPGAGGDATASAIIGDLMAIARGEAGPRA
jgi:homoserine dehydrogenase